MLGRTSLQVSLKTVGIQPHMESKAEISGLLLQFRRIILSVGDAFVFAHSKKSSVQNVQIIGSNGLTCTLQ